jgi:molybdopterin synthase sulfur carrier subunit
MKPDDSRLSTVQLRYFARLRETFASEGERIALPAGVEDVAGLVAWLRARGEPWDRELAPGRPVRVAVNQDMAEPGTPVRSGDEVAIFPPVTGG